MGLVRNSAVLGQFIVSARKILQSQTAASKFNVKVSFIEDLENL